MLLFTLAGVMLLVVLPSMLMYLLRFDHAFWPVAHWVKGEAGGDSWDSMVGAIDYVAAHGGKGLYDATYYGASHQFIYPPTSLVFADLTARFGLLDWHSTASMNRVSWWLVPAMMLTFAAVAITEQTRRGETPTRYDAILSIVLGACTVLLFFPIMRGYTSGQIQTWLNLLLSLALLSWMLERKIIAGVAVGLVCVIKPQLGVLVVWALLRKEWRFAGALAATGALFFVASVAMYGWEVQGEYIRLLGFLSHRGESYFANQSMNGLLNRMLFIGNNLEWDGKHTLVTYNFWVNTLTMVSSVALIALVLLYRRQAIPGPLDLGLALAGLTLASPVAYQHHFGFLAVVFLLTLLNFHARRVRTGAYAWLALAFMLCANSPGITKSLAATHFNFLQSYSMFGVLLLIGLLIWATRERDFTAMAPALQGA